MRRLLPHSSRPRGGRPTLACALLLALSPMTAGAQDDRLAGGRPMTVDDMLRMARFGDVLLSLATGAGGGLCSSWAGGHD
ncbi:MAG: hypothetical protein QF391_16210 [Myxococcota bacterium]|nr:hypothetical protein [Myxococcota bacterium]